MNTVQSKIGKNEFDQILKNINLKVFNGSTDMNLLTNLIFIMLLGACSTCYYLLV